ncbi:hypothetical protein SANA_31220 [Gottschalkiaceae bacterium SANA]|nr:hypothetical protein SANA_31220 [Gottschalkiaceae bacterium SANA]
MRIIKKTMICLILFLLTIQFPFAATPQEEAADSLVTLGLLTGYPDGGLRLDRTITRAEFATLMVRMLPAQESSATPLTDISAHWAKKNIEKAYKAGIIAGYPDKSFQPDAPITYGEIMTVLVRSLGYGQAIDPNLPWPDNYVQKAIDLNIHGGVKIPMRSNASRGDMAVFLSQSLVTQFNK